MMTSFKKTVLGLVVFGVFSLSLTTFAQAPDTVLPSEVANVKAIAGDSEVMLTWDASADNVGVTGYKIYMGLESVKDGSKEYNLPTIEAGNVQEYKVGDLKNGTAYYFALTAADKQGNESEYYSDEISATPQAVPADDLTADTTGSANDTTAPTVTSAVGSSNTEVKVVFSEKIILPTQAPESAFSIQDQAKSKQLVIIAAALDSTDTAGKTVLLTTEPQSIGATYVVTAGISITDSAGNTLQSGVSDIASFKGADDTATPTDGQGPKISETKSLSSVMLQVTFSEPVILDQTQSTSNFKIYKSSDETALLPVYKVEMDKDEMTVLLTTEAQAGSTEYIVEVSGVADKSGNLIADGFDSTAVFTSNGGDLVDLIAPEDITNLLSSATSTVVKLSWTGSVNSAGDLADQILYRSLDKGKTYEPGQSLGTTITKYELKDLKPDTEYTFKITVKDKTGNESAGLITTIKTLPQTGPGIGFLVLSALGAAGYVTRRRGK